MAAHPRLKPDVRRLIRLCIGRRNRRRIRLRLYIVTRTQRIVAPERHADVYSANRLDLQEEAMKLFEQRGSLQRLPARLGEP